MESGDRFGSEELTEEEFAEAELRQEEILAELYEAVAERDQAKEFLNTKFGIALRKTLVGETLRAMKACAESIGSPQQSDNLIQYRVIKKVQFIFGLIISDGEEALRQLKVKAGDGNEYEG